MKTAHCARCGVPITVDDDFDLDEDMDACGECDAILRDMYEEGQK